MPYKPEIAATAEKHVSQVPALAMLVAQVQKEIMEFEAKQAELSVEMNKYLKELRL